MRERDLQLLLLCPQSDPIDCIIKSIRELSIQFLSKVIKIIQFHQLEWKHKTFQELISGFILN